MKEEKLSLISDYGIPERLCPNPKCISGGGNYLPTRENQVYCCPKCRIKFNNDRRSEEANTIFLDAKQLIAIDKKLHRMYEKYADNKGYCHVRKEIFHYESIDVMLLVKEFESKYTSAKVKGYFRYGIELHPKDNNFYIITKLT